MTNRICNNGFYFSSFTYFYFVGKAYWSFAGVGTAVGQRQ